MYRLLKSILFFKQGNIITHLLRYRYIMSYPLVKIDFWVEIWDKRNKKIGKWSWIRKWVVIQNGNLKIGNDTHVWPYSCIFPGTGIKIGSNVLIGPHVGIYAGTHNYKDRDILISEQGDYSKGIIIHDDVWIWAGAIILDGITIRKGSVIWAWAIVTRSTEEYSISVWNPAKIVWYRQ